jgi:hypothetical protein
MSLIDETYFIGELNLPNLNEESEIERLQLFIDKYEPKFLTELLGYGLYKDFKAGLLVNPVADKWKALRDGGEYTYSGSTFRWNGLKQADGSMIANYVYYWWMRNELTQTTGMGEVATKSENSVRVSASNKMTSAWNEMVNQVWALTSFMNASIVDYPDWQWYGGASSQYYYNSPRLRDIFYQINSFNL